MILADTKSCRDTSSLLKTHLFIKICRGLNCFMLVSLLFAIMLSLRLERLLLLVYVFLSNRRMLELMFGVKEQKSVPHGHLGSRCPCLCICMDNIDSGITLPALTKESDSGTSSQPFPGWITKLALPVIVSSDIYVLL